MAPSGPKALKNFIEDIPDHKLDGLPRNEDTLYKDRNYRLDMQGMTSSKPAEHNLQVQVNRDPKISSLKNAKGATVAGPVLAPGDGSMTPAEIRAGLQASRKI
ncbi:hypothetical protein LTR53_016854 [Teratosphaeriaceae sp. CCFEE 6253]|nr:hypothetical protein LTR53_016854 [Teratosphaeriaceae sp. CCFEE 6253]